MRRFLALLLVASSMGATCGRAQPDAVDEVWASHEADWQRASETFDQKGLMQAAAFFEEVTGIHSYLEVTYLGVLPIKTDESLAAWKALFRQNRRLLYLDPSSGKIER